MARSTRNDYAFYSAEQDRKDHERFLLAGHLHCAIDEDQFFVLYQPKVDILKLAASLGSRRSYAGNIPILELFRRTYLFPWQSKQV